MVEKFSLRHKRIMLTYKTHIDKKKLVQFLNTVLPVRFYGVCHETGNEEFAYLHTHALIWFGPVQPNIKNCRRLDYEGIHPHIKRIIDDGHWANSVTYIQKEDTSFYANCTDDLQCASVKVQVDKILSKRTWGQVLCDEDTAGIAQSRLWWCKEVHHGNLKRRRIERRRHKTKVHVRYGPSGSGKSEYFWDKYPNADDVRFVNGFLIGYNGGDVVIIDDLKPDIIPCGLLLNLMDRYPCTVNVKGGEVEWSPKLLCITANHHPKVWSSSIYIQDDQVHPILRRIDKLEEIDY